ncbi:hypothetical protein D6T64_10350 [Cryobacterium melibiosiphilum]|uniref:Prepilin-type N-terminal cleavage/methylation domain-containing protein n=1 Tax=Cryobacterium melibiosiphilum TaxID=995039 RepID=A0A3A5MI29_9MICO|nr:hypothetical protein [Cryobacterium melibiosiphilum]RJT88521.1 hypothetical protein D6T64_10350 [Cryobacterium melibiosiphilum]
MAQSRSAQVTSDGGFTLVELLVYVAFAVIVLTLVGGMLISTLTAEKDIVSRSESTTAGQSVAQSVHSAVRNSARLLLSPTDTGQLLVVSSVGGAAVLATSCEAWYYTDVDGGALYFKRADLAADLLEKPSAGVGNGWILLVQGMEPLAYVDEVFTDSISAAGTATVSLSFTADVVNQGSPIVIESTTTSREVSWGPTTCFES